MIRVEDLPQDPVLEVIDEGARAAAGDGVHATQRSVIDAAHRMIVVTCLPSGRRGVRVVRLSRLQRPYLALEDSQFVFVVEEVDELHAGEGGDAGSGFVVGFALVFDGADEVSGVWDPGF